MQMATAIYGSRAATVLILITTKKDGGNQNLSSIQILVLAALQISQTY